jgi:hypothetical protein
VQRARETVRKQDGLARILPDNVVAAVIETNSGPLSPGRCLAILIGGRHSPAQAVATEPQPNPQAAQANSPVMIAAVNEMVVAIDECRAKRLAGELKSYVESAQCSNPHIIRAMLEIVGTPQIT